MAGDIVGLTCLTGLSITSTPGSAQTTISLPVLQVQGGGKVIVDSGSSVIFSSSYRSPTAAIASSSMCVTSRGSA